MPVVNTKIFQLRLGIGSFPDLVNRHSKTDADSSQDIECLDRPRYRFFVPDGELDCCTCTWARIKNEDITLLGRLVILIFHVAEQQSVVHTSKL